MPPISSPFLFSILIRNSRSFNPFPNHDQKEGIHLDTFFLIYFLGNNLKILNRSGTKYDLAISSKSATVKDSNTSMIENK